jgi:predicted ABC-type transport system involved in lysophospholipase L1 biosynthesis ATPase subunit
MSTIAGASTGDGHVSCYGTYLCQLDEVAFATDSKVVIPQRSFLTVSRSSADECANTGLLLSRCAHRTEASHDLITNRHRLENFGVGTILEHMPYSPVGIGKWMFDRQ